MKTKVSSKISNRFTLWPLKIEMLPVFIGMFPMFIEMLPIFIEMLPIIIEMLPVFLTQKLLLPPHGALSVCNLVPRRKNQALLDKFL